MKFSNKERKDLFFAGLMISLAFAILLSGGFRGIVEGKFLVSFTAAFLTAGSGFLLHELAHKFVAQRYHLWAEFEASYTWLFLAVAFSFAGFIFAAPGAVVIRGLKPLTREKNGKISLAGPLMNIILAVLFLLVYLSIGKGIVGSVASYGLTINSLLAAFNMIPVAPFDGSKIKDWNGGVYLLMTILAVGLFATSFFF